MGLHIGYKCKCQHNLVERLWRTVKYEEVYLKAYANGLEARNGLREYFRFYNHRLNCGLILSNRWGPPHLEVDPENWTSG